MTKPGEHDPIRIIDIVVLIASTALGLAAIRVYFATPGWIEPFPSTFMISGPPSLSSSLRNGGFLSRAASALLLAWSPALLWCGWRRGRRGIGKIVERPGLLACAVAVLVAPSLFFVPVTFEVAAPRGAEFRIPGLAGGMVTAHFLEFLTRKVGICVILAWLALAASRSWRKPAGWVEWAALAVGIGWIGTWLTSLVFG